MTTFPLIVKHAVAVGTAGRREVSASIIQAVAALAVARGTDRIIVPVPGAEEHDLAREAIDTLPRERREMVSLVDQEGEILRRVRSFLAPLSRQVVKWPEDAFVSFSEPFLYKMALASREKAGILDNDVSVLRDFVPIIDPTRFSGEARFRLAELVHLICSYEPVAPEHLSYATDLSTAVAKGVWHLLDTAEHIDLVVAHGRLGYLRRPRVGLRMIADRVRDLLANSAAGGLLKLSAVAGDLSGGGGSLVTASATLSEVLEAGARDFAPPFFNLGPAALGVYRVALLEAFPDASAPEGTAMVFETTLGGRKSASWLALEDEDKLEREAAAGLEPRIEKAKEAVRARDRFFMAGEVSPNDV